MPRRIKRPAIAAALATSVVMAANAHATTWVEVEHTCPIGGEEFTAMEVASNSYFGSRPDGRRYGPLPIVPVTECPSNGLPLFDDFSDEELALLEPAIAMPEFVSMRASETQRYRVAWLMEQLGRAPVDIASTLLVATWEADGNFDQKTRYQGEYVMLVTGIERTEENADSWFFLHTRAANALRELGYFEEAANLITRINREEYFPDDTEIRGYVEQYFANLGALVAEENYVVEPANMVPTYQAAMRCGLALPLPTASEVPVCESEEVIELIEDFEIEDDEGNDLEGRAAFEYLRNQRSAANEGS